MKRGNGEPPSPGGDEDVGYGKPPRRSRFKPGQSGNPKGRPKRAVGKHQQLVEAMDQPTRRMFMAEMQRPITVTSGGEKVTMQTIQMITRAMAKSAAEGGQQAQRTAVMLQLELEREAAAENAKFLEAVIKAKELGYEVLAKCRARGLPPPRELVPHPDDIFIDEATRHVEIRGPSTPGQKAAFDKFLALRNGYQRGVTGLQLKAAAKPRDWTLPVLAAEAQERYDMMNRLLPERYRKMLENRMTAAEIELAWKNGRKGLDARKRRRAGRRGENRGSRSAPQPEMSS